MRKEIDQFMWGYQSHFRLLVEHTTARILDKIGIASEDVTVILVGIAAKDDARHPICVEPETGSLKADHLEQVVERAKAIYRLDPASEIFHSHPSVREARHRGLTLSSRAKAITEAIETSGQFNDFTFFTSHSAPINDYEVHTCLGLPTLTIEHLPAFKDDTVHDYYYAARSLTHEVIRECLSRADKQLYLPSQGTDLRGLGREEDIIAVATQNFMHGIAMHTTGDFFSNLFSNLNAASSLTYERAGAKGRLTVTRHENLAQWLTVTFKEPVSLGASRTLRKLLQLSDGKMSVLADQNSAYGLGPSKKGPDIIEISITGHAKWEASVNDEKFVSVSYGEATLPKQPIEFQTLEDVAERTVGSINTSGIWKIIQAAQASGHGATIVVSKNAAAEATRLRGEGMPIEPNYLEPEEVVQLASVDGAVIIDTNGQCHAFGVILDGTANEGGDRARGARFNSSVRYQSGETVASMIVVISDDGTVDLLPNLKPRVHRSEIEAAVDEFCRYCDAETVEGETWARLYRNVERIQFYLSEEQCLRINEKHDQEMDRRLASGGSKTFRAIRPNPRMNESHFWEPRHPE